MTILKTFLVALVVAPILDFIWLGLAMSGFYMAQLGPLARQKEDGGFAPILWAAVVVYLCIAAGTALFVLPRTDGSMASAAIWGGVFGLVLYGVYDMTNYSLVQNWPLAMSLVDMAWGGVICALTAAVASRFT